MIRRRPRASKVLLAASLLVAAVATLLLRGHLARLEARAAVPGDPVPVVLAAADLPRGTRLTPGMVRGGEVPRAYLPPGAARSPDEVVGRTLAADVAAGEVITDARLGRAGPVASLVPPGLRAMALTVSLPRGAVASGDRVDVLAVLAGRPFAERVASSLEVLLVREGEGPEGLGTATTLVVLVDPAAAERLAHARTLGDLSVTIAPAEEPGPLD